MSGRLLISVALLTAWASASADGSIPAAASQPAEPTTQAARADGGPSQSAPPRLKLRDSEGEQSTPDNGTGVMLQMLAYMLVIVVLGVVVLVVVKRVLPRIGIAASSKKRISVVETLHLGQRKTVMVLRVGTQKILVANCRDRLSVLADVTGALEDLPEASPDSEQQG